MKRDRLCPFRQTRKESSVCHKLQNHYPANLKAVKTLAIILCLLISTLVPVVGYALKIDDTHYRFCVMDEAKIYDAAALKSDNNGSLASFASVHWYSENGVLLFGESTEAQSGATSAYVLMSKPYSGASSSLWHPWVEAGYSHTTYFYITVDAPSGVVFDNLPSKLLVNDEAKLGVKLTGEYTPFSGTGYFSYTYTSSNPSIISVGSHTIKANALGKAVITAEVYARNRTYTDKSYKIGTAKIEIEVVDNMDPTDISISEREMLMNVGDKGSLKVSLTPDDAKTTVSWSSSNDEIATVREGLIEAVGRGNAVIEARTSNGLSAKCYVTVLDAADYENVFIETLYYNLDRSSSTATVVAPADGTYYQIQGEVMIPESVDYYNKTYRVVSIGDRAFESSSITSVTLPATISTIGSHSFAGTIIRDVDLPDGLKEIGEFAFANGMLESVMIGKNVSLIGHGAFSDCEMLRAVYVDSDNKYFTVYEDCLYNKTCKTLYYVPIVTRSITFPTALEVIGSYSCLNNKLISQLALPENLRVIGQSAFEGCELLENLSFPNSVQEIETTAFKGCDKVREVRLGDKINIMGDNVFTSPCLEKVLINTLMPPSIEESTFGNYDATLIVPRGRVAAYQKNPVWNKFSLITDEEVVPIKEIKLSDEVLSLSVGSTYTLTASVLPENVTDKTLVWESSDSGVAQVNQEGRVEAVTPGTATVTARSGDGAVSASCTVTVTPILVSEIALSELTLDLLVGESWQLTASVYPENATDKTLLWESSDSEIIAVSEEGLVSLLTPGTATITVRSADGGATAACVVTANPILVSDITLNETTLDLRVGDIHKLSATVSPDNATDKTLAWQSSNADVAEVDEAGVIHALAAGESIITATSIDGGATASCGVNVKEDSGIQSVFMDDTEVIFTLTGIKISEVSGKLSPGVYLLRRGNRISKIVVK